MGSQLAAELDRDGVVMLPELVPVDQLAGMQRAFASRLRRMRWNDVDGYEQSDRYRRMVQDLLLIHQGFLDLALHPAIKEALHEYLGADYRLVEAKGWMSVPTHRDFAGWHGDMWYDQEQVKGIPREVKLGLFLTDVRTGGFAYIRGSHRKQAPHVLRAAEGAGIPPGAIEEMTGPAGTTFLFDTSGIHRQRIPILEPRHAAFFAYHDPRVPLQADDTEYNRYHPVLLNAAFLGRLSSDDQRRLGFGETFNYIEGFERRPTHQAFERLLALAFAPTLWASEFRERVSAKLRARRG